MDDNFLGVGLPDYGREGPPTLIEVAKAIRAIDDLAAATELILDVEPEIRKATAVLSWLVERDRPSPAELESSLLSLCDTLATAVQEPREDFNIGEVRDSIREQYLLTEGTIWPYSSLSASIFRFAESARKIGEGRQHFEWLAAFAERSSLIATKAEDSAMTLRRFRVYVDSLAQLAALTEYISMNDAGNVNADQAEQAAQLAATLRQAMTSGTDPGPTSAASG